MLLYRSFQPVFKAPGCGGGALGSGPGSMTIVARSTIGVWESLVS